MFKFSKKSISYLNNVNPILKRIAEEVLSISKVDFSITCGSRTLEEQKKLFDEKKSKTLNSKHLTGDAIDIVPFINNKQDFEAVKDLAYIIGLFDATSKKKGIELRFGAFWDNSNIKNNNFLDMYHIEIKKEE